MLAFGIVLFLILSAIFSGSEIAFISANRLDVEIKKNKRGTRSRFIQYFYDNPNNFLGTMLVGNNIALVVFTTLLTIPLERFLTHYFHLPEGVFMLLSVTVITTIIILIFGEFLPKTLFKLYGANMLFLLAIPLRIVMFLLGLPTKFMVGLTNVMLKKSKGDELNEPQTVFTRLDLQEYVEDTNLEKELEVDKSIFGKALRLKETRVRDCLIPRTEIEYVDISASIQELEEKFIETGLSRLIVVEDDIENVKGYVHHQSLFHSPRSIVAIMRPLQFVPEVLFVSNLMRTFMKKRTNIACVVNEFGGVSGLITLEDIIEEIFGEIEDEHDEEGEYIEEVVSDNEFRFSGRMEIDQINEKYRLDIPADAFQTLSGYLVMTRGEIPEEGEVIQQDRYNFVIEEVSNTKIETVRVIKRD